MAKKELKKNGKRLERQRSEREPNWHRRSAVINRTSTGGGRATSLAGTMLTEDFSQHVGDLSQRRAGLDGRQDRRQQIVRAACGVFQRRQRACEVARVALLTKTSEAFNLRLLDRRVQMVQRHRRARWGIRVVLELVLPHD